MTRYARPPKPHAEIRFNVISGDVSESHLFECCAQMLHRALINFVGLLRAKRGLGKVLQIETCPFRELEFPPSAHRGQGVIVSGLQALSEDLLRLIPILNPGRLSLALPGLVPVLHPPD